ncbi:hypothetical protein F941_00352 [Acinetobacter bouvetii DSM 14964 = CIP 107468]|uniref:Fe2OG dioxygenase domain-containing protein n=2 Tax=Acinetobacter bouvetii TaxID=202951 RepID=N9CEM4_9GAMM|nr:hypothetical protein F941_00352 [Acinetobacter bouvetii DSM 14964 = CIP 107468]BCU65993.1 hypothetical protein ACBO_27840 [Acinetobacter bouvetii]
MIQRLMELKWLRWQKGRQQSGYDKMLIIYNKLGVECDAYLLRFLVGSMIPQHQDPVQKGRHFRLNIIIKKSQSGGEFICERDIINLPRIKLFRPDLYRHEVTEVVGSPRYVLSIGWVLDESLKCCK